MDLAEIVDVRDSEKSEEFESQLLVHFKRETSSCSGRPLAVDPARKSVLVVGEFPRSRIEVSSMSPSREVRSNPVSFPSSQPCASESWPFYTSLDSSELGEIYYDSLTTLGRTSVERSLVFSGSFSSETSLTPSDFDVMFPSWAGLAIGELPSDVEFVDSIPIKSAASLIAEIRANLSLRIGDLADVLRVARPTIYSWMGAESEPHEVNWKRLLRVSELSRKWSSLSNLPLGKQLKRQYLPNEPSLFELLKEDSLDEPRILKTLRAILDGQGASKTPMGRSHKAKHPQRNSEIDVLDPEPFVED